MPLKSNAPESEIEQASSTPHLVSGQPVSLETALDEAERVLTAAVRPAIIVGPFVTLEAATAAVSLAEVLGAIVDSGRGHEIPARGTSFHLQGESRTTQGEYRDADLIVAVGCGQTELRQQLIDPKIPATPIYLVEVSESDDFREIELELTQDFIPKCKIDASRPGEFQLRCDEWSVGDDTRARLRRRTAEHRQRAADDKWDELFGLWHAAKFPLLIYHANALGDAADLESARTIVQGLEQIVIDKARDGRAAAVAMEERSPELEYVLTARTGFSDAVDFASGRAEFAPWRTSAQTEFARDGVDCVMSIGHRVTSDLFLETQISTGDALTNTIDLDGSPETPGIVLTTLCPKEEPGTHLRGDGVPTIERKPLPSDALSLQTLIESILTRVLSAQEANAR